MANKNIHDDLKPIFVEARLLAIAWKHEFINYDHLFVAMLKKNCLATNYISHCDAAVWEVKIKDTYPANGKNTLRDSLPLSISGERVLFHARKIAVINNERSMNTIHLLLAILSFENEVTESLLKEGVHIDDIKSTHLKNETAPFPSAIKPIRAKTFFKIRAFFMSHSAKSKKSAELYSNAVDLYLYHQYENSIEVCRAGIKLSPTNLDLKLLLAYNHIRMRDYGLALNPMIELANLYPESTSYQLSLGNIYNAMGNYTEAASVLDALLLREPNNDTFLNNRGFNLLLQQQYLESLPFFEKASEKNPTAAYAWNNLGFAKYKLGETEEAIGLIDRSLALDKGNSFAYKNKGIIFMEQGDKNGAFKNFILALKFGYTEKYGDEVLRLIKNIT